VNRTVPPAGAEPESTEEYPLGTDGYSAPPAPPASSDPAPPGSPDAGEAPAASSRAGGAESEATPFWKREGFGSFRDYMDYLQRQQRLYDPTPLRGSEVPAGSLPADPQPDQPGSLLRVHQVNVKLRAGEYDDLIHVAELYGLPAATLARVLVNRGVRAVLDEESDGEQADRRRS